MQQCPIVTGKNLRSPRPSIGKSIEVKAATGTPDDIKGRIRACNRVQRPRLPRPPHRQPCKIFAMDLQRHPRFRLLENVTHAQWSLPCSRVLESIINPHLIIIAPRACIDYVLIHGTSRDLRTSDQRRGLLDLIERADVWPDWRKSQGPSLWMGLVDVFLFD